MQWHDLGTFTVSNNWQYTKQVVGQYFKIAYLSSPLLARNSTGTIALANMPENGFVDSTEFFKPQRISSYLPSEIISFPEPLRGWDYRLAIKKLVLPNQPTLDFTIQIFMPVIDLTPDQPAINPTISTSKNPTSVSIPAATTTAVKLLPINASSTRKHATFYNGSAKRTLYIDSDSTINNASALAKVAPGKLYISDNPGWQGEYWGVLADGSDTTASSITIEEYL